MSRETVQRRAVRRAAQIRCQAVELAGFTLLSEHVIDLSARGMLVGCDRCLRVGEEVQISFRAPCHNPFEELWFDAEAVVARVVAGQRWSDEGFGAGLEFTYFEKSSRHELSSRLANLPLPAPRFRDPAGLFAKNSNIPRGVFKLSL